MDIKEGKKIYSTSSVIDLIHKVQQTVALHMKEVYNTSNMIFNKDYVTLTVVS